MKKSIYAIIPLLLTVYVFQASGQTGPVFSHALSPRIEWTSITWSPYKNDWTTPMEQDESGEDWWMDVIEYYENGIHVGYAACGFSSWPEWEEHQHYAPCAYADMTEQIRPDLFITDGNRRGIQRQTVGIFDLKGNLLNLYRFNAGDCYKIYQAANEDLIITGYAFNPTPFSDNDDKPMYVNPISGNNPSGFDTYDLSNFPSGFCDEESSQRKREFNVIRIEPNGDIVYNNYFNNGTSLEDSFHSWGVGRAIAAADGDNIYVVGTVSGNPFIVKLDDEGHLIWKSNETAYSDCVYLWIDKYEDKYVLTGRYQEPLGPIAVATAFMEFVDLDAFAPGADELAFANPIWDEHTTEANGYDSYGFNFPDPVNPVWGEFQHTSTSVCFTESGDIVWPVMANNERFYFSQHNECDGKIFIFNQSGAMINTNNEPIEMGKLRAFDLYFSATSTDDGGFAIVSSRHSPQYFGTSNLPSYYDPDIGPCLDEIIDDVATIPDSETYWWGLAQWDDYFHYWSTCAYIAKFDDNYEFEWDKIWDSTDNAPRECFPGNLKQQECVYRIIQTSDGGFVICGNTSDNLDDNYLVKIASDCGIRDFIAGIESDGTITDSEIIVDLDDGIFEIDANTTWNSDKKVLGRVRVKDGYTLTIDNAEVGFAGNANIASRIEIEQNAQLILDGATLTNSQYTPEACPQMWRGIEVWGTTTERQNPISGYYHQGRLKADNSKIENANNAIANWKDQDWDARGGIIQVTNTEFLNNRRSAGFVSYQNTTAGGLLTNDLSYFRNCEFVLNDDYIRGPAAAHPQVTLWDNHGISFRGCEFRNDMTIAENSQQLTSGIYSISAYYKVNDYCPVPQAVGQPCTVTPIPSSFTGFHHGILATVGSSGAKHIDVSNSVFSDNMTGIELRETDFSVIRQNEFYVGEHPFEPILEEERNMGVFTFETSAYSIEENHFEKVGSNGWPTHGAVIQASGAAENELYKNDLEGLMYGSVAIDNNRSDDNLGEQGLQFLCNDNVHNGRDFDVIDLANHPFRGIRGSQGDYPGVAAANTFSQSSAYSLDFMHFAQDQDMPLVGYAWYSGDLLQEPSSTEVTSNVDLGYSTSTERTCPSNFGGKHVADFKSAFDSASTEYYNLLYNYHQLTDGGDTEGLLDEIAGTWPQEAWDLRNSLLEDSPFLTVQVLIAAADRDILPHAMLMEVLLANPDALRSSQLIDHLQYYMPNPLPQYMIDILLDARSEITVKTNLLGAMGQKSRTMAVNHKMVIQEMLSDTLGVDPDSLLWFMGRLENIPNHYALAMTHLEMGDPADGQTVLTNMRVIWDRMNTEEETEWEQFNDLYALFRSVQADGRNEARLTESEIQDLLTIAQTPNSGRAGGRAWNTLCFHYSICPEGQLPPAPRSYEAYQAQNALSTASYKPVEAYPNPANSYTTLRYELFQSHPQTYIRIFDVTGRVTQSFTLGENYEGQVLWDTREAKPGIYFYQLWQNDEQVHSGKIVVQH